MNHSLRYKFSYRREFKERLEKLDREAKNRIKEKIKEFREHVNIHGVDPRLHGSTKFVVSYGVWRLRVGDYRVFFDFVNNEIKFLTVLHRKEAYR